MSEKVPIDAAGHPERDAWRAWVTDGFQAMYGSAARPSGGVVYVRAYIRNGLPVAAHTRGAPSSAGEGGINDRTAQPARGGQFETPGPVEVGFPGMPLRRRNLLDDALVEPVTARRPEDGPVGGRRGVIPEGGGGYRPPGRPGQTPGSQAPAIPPRSQELVDMVAPGGQPVGSTGRRGSQHPHPARRAAGGRGDARATNTRQGCR